MDDQATTRTLLQFILEQADGEEKRIWLALYLDQAAYGHQAINFSLPRSKPSQDMVQEAAARQAALFGSEVVDGSLELLQQSAINTANETIPLLFYAAQVRRAEGWGPVEHDGVRYEAVRPSDAIQSDIFAALRDVIIKRYELKAG